VTDGRTDGIAIACARLAYMLSRAKIAHQNPWGGDMGSNFQLSPKVPKNVGISDPNFAFFETSHEGLQSLKVRVPNS